MSELPERYDVVICDTKSNTVKSIAGINLKLPDAIIQWDRVSKCLLPHRFADVIEGGTMKVGAPAPRNLPVVAPPERYSRPVLQFRNPQERRENSVCIVCESPALATAIHCAACAATANEITSRRNRPRL